MPSISFTSSQKELRQYHNEHKNDYAKLKDHPQNVAIDVQFRGKQKIYHFHNLAGFDLKPGQLVLVLTHVPKHRNQLQIEKAKVVQVQDYQPDTMNCRKYYEPIIDVM